MIARIIPEAYDAIGKQVLRPFDRRRGPHFTFPMGRYVSQPLTVKCADRTELRQFLVGCKPVSDEEQFGQRDYWQPPEDFERTKTGDCDDFALWTWRQLMDMGYDCRVEFGQHGRYGTGHAWVEFFVDGNCYLVEPHLRFLGAVLPEMSTLHYHPKFSVAGSDQKLLYYQHADHKLCTSPLELAKLLPEYIIWGVFWMKNIWRTPAMIWRSLLRIRNGFRWPKGRQ